MTNTVKLDCDRELLAEAIHTSFRKFADHPTATDAWRAIGKMPGDQWSAVVNAIAEYGVRSKPNESVAPSYDQLVALLESVVTLAQEAHAKWDADEDVRVGKMLMALAGYRPGYRADTDAIHNAKSDDPS